MSDFFGAGFRRIAPRGLPVVLAGLVATALVFPGLGSGLWEPSEVSVADMARGVRGGGAYPPLAHALPSAGLRVFGAGELSARLPVAIGALGCILLTAWIGARVFGRRAGLLAALVLATSPAFLFHARQVSSEILPLTAGLAAWGGVLLIGHGPRWAALSLSAAGLALGSLSAGVLVGAALPLGAAALSLGLVGSRAEVGRATTLGVAAVGVATCVTVGVLLARGGESPAWIGGVVHRIANPPSFDAALKTVAHGAFPWSALLPLALLHMASSPDRPGALARVHLLVVTALGLAVALLAAWRLREIRDPTLVAFALVVGVYLDDALNAQAGGPFAALFAACGAVILGRDLFLAPQALLQAQHLEGLKYPADMGFAGVHLVVGLAFALVAWLGLGWWRRVLAGLVLVTVPYAAFAAHELMPALGHHFSSKDLMDVFEGSRKEGEPLARYRVPGHVGYVRDGEIRKLRSREDLLAFLNRPGRVFALIGGAELAPIDQTARREGIAYHVLDDSSSRALLVSNRLAPGETDRNPLRRYVFGEPTQPGRSLHADFEGRVQLTGFDLPHTAERGSNIRIGLHFHVTGTLPANWKLFVHFDRPAYRIHGDHLPLGGKLPTQYWSPGDYIVDEHDLEIPRLTTPSGRYSVYMGFWQGQKRLKVLEGPSDGADRVRLGFLHVE